MRTTLTLDDDLAEKLRELAHRRRVPFKQVVNDLLRAALGGAGNDDRKPFELDPFASAFKPGVDPGKLNQLLDSLDADSVRDEAED